MVPSARRGEEPLDDELLGLSEADLTPDDEHVGARLAVGACGMPVQAVGGDGELWDRRLLGDVEAGERSPAPQERPYDKGIGGNSQRVQQRSDSWDLAGVLCSLGHGHAHGEAELQKPAQAVHGAPPGALAAMSVVGLGPCAVEGGLDDQALVAGELLEPLETGGAQQHRVCEQDGGEPARSVVEQIYDLGVQERLPAGHVQLGEVFGDCLVDEITKARRRDGTGRSRR